MHQPGKLRQAADSPTDLTALVQPVDRTLDDALTAYAAGDTETAWGLVADARAAAARLLEALTGPDDDSTGGQADPGDLSQYGQARRIQRRERRSAARRAKLLRVVRP